MNEVRVPAKERETESCFHNHQPKPIFHACLGLRGRKVLIGLKERKSAFHRINEKFIKICNSR